MSERDELIAKARTWERDWGERRTSGLITALADLAESEGRRADLNAKHCAEMTAARNRMDEARALACSERDAALAELAAMKGLQP